LVIAALKIYIEAAGLMGYTHAKSKPKPRPAATDDLQYNGSMNTALTYALPQAYALLISGAPGSADHALLQQLAQKALRIIAVDSGADAACAAGIVPELVIGDLDSVSADALALVRSKGAEVRAADTRKDETDLELALNYCSTELPQGCTLCVTNALGGRLDHELASLGALARAAELKPLIIESRVVVAFLSSAYPTLTFAELGVMPGFLVSVIALEGEAVVSEHGMEYGLDHARLRPLDPRGVSNIVSTKDAYVCVHKGSVAVFINGKN
jgi:thiamine pyrophosphokinase